MFVHLTKGVFLCSSFLTGPGSLTFTLRLSGPGGSHD